MFRQKHFKATLGAALGVVVVALAVMIGGSSMVDAKGNGGIGGIYEETGSLEGLRSARGVVADWAQTDQTSTGGIVRDWVISGEWTLNCNGKCTKANLSRIDFDMAFAMYRESVKAEGNSSHGHQFWDFSAENVTLAGDTLIIDGQITGSSGIGTDEIQIKLRRQTNGNFTFSFKMDDGTLSGPPNVIVTEVAGAVIESRGRRR